MPKWRFQKQGVSANTLVSAAQLGDDLMLRGQITYASSRNRHQKHIFSASLGAQARFSMASLLLGFDLLVATGAFPLITLHKYPKFLYRNTIRSPALPKDGRFAPSRPAEEPDLFISMSMMNIAEVRSAVDWSVIPRQPKSSCRRISGGLGKIRQMTCDVTHCTVHKH